MKKGSSLISLILLLFISAEYLSSQEKTAKNAQNKAEENKKAGTVPKNLQAIYSEKIDIKNVYFNKEIDYTGKGEVLEVELKVKNLIDDPQDIYIFVIATYEHDRVKESSFQMPNPDYKKLLSFVPYPDDIENFQYKDPENNDKTILSKFPKNPKAGINIETGKAYHLTDFFYLRSKHLSKYRNNYYFFNRVTILAYNNAEKLIFMENYKIVGVRR